MKYTPQNITELAPNEIFVFGSNTEGRHGKGAARLALHKFGASWGVGEGLMGDSYALPTVGDRLSKMPVKLIKEYADRFIECADLRPDLTFYLTEVGCGLAGHKVEDIAPLFKNCPPNVIKPESFHKHENA